MSRKTTFNERVEIVEWINKGNHSYSEAAEHFNVSYNNFLAQHEVTRSMSRPGTPYDNALMERWWNEFKLCWIDRHAKPVTYKELVALVEEGINYFNQLDRSPARNDLTPAEYWNEAV